jgi:hypothetical protein
MTSDGDIRLPPSDFHLVTRLPSRSLGEGWSPVTRHFCDFFLLRRYFGRELHDAQHQVGVTRLVEFGPAGEIFVVKAVANVSLAEIISEMLVVNSTPFSVNDPFQRSRLKIQVAFCLGVRHASHLSPVVNRIRTTIPFQSILN